MKTVSISGSSRANVGKKDAKALRREGLVPCVLYGGTEQVAFAVPEKSFTKIIYSSDVHMINLDLSGKNYNAVVKELQFHPVSDKLIHVDFMEVISGKAITVVIPIQFTGSAAGVREGGKLQRK